MSVKVVMMKRLILIYIPMNLLSLIILNFTNIHTENAEIEKWSICSKNKMS